MTSKNLTRPTDRRRHLSLGLWNSSVLWYPFHVRAEVSDSWLLGGAPVCRNPRTDCSARVTQTWGIRLTHLSPGHVHYTPPNLQEPTVGTLTTPQRVLPIDGRCHENQIRAQKAFHQGKRDGSSFINHNKFSLAQFHSICRMYILWERKCISLAWSPNVTAVITGEASCKLLTFRRSSHFFFLSFLLSTFPWRGKNGMVLESDT